MKLKLWGVGALVVAGALAFWRWEVAATERDAARLQVEQMRERMTEQARELEQLAVALELEYIRAGRLVEVEQGIESLRQTLVAQGAEHRAGLEELKRNDEDVRDYLRGLVPGALGVRYARPETTDPASYRGSAPVPPGAVPASRPASPGDE